MIPKAAAIKQTALIKIYSKKVWKREGETVNILQKSSGRPRVKYPQNYTPGGEYLFVFRTVQIALISTQEESQYQWTLNPQFQAITALALHQVA